MRQIHKNCGSCNQPFIASRKNQIYCTPECRSDINNDKLKEKLHHAKNINGVIEERDKYRKQLEESIRIVEIRYNVKDENEYIHFEGKRYEKVSEESDFLDKIGIQLTSNSADDNKKTRLGIYFGSLQLIYFRKTKPQFSYSTVVYQLVGAKTLDTIISNM